MTLESWGPLWVSAIPAAAASFAVGAHIAFSYRFRGFYPPIFIGEIFGMLVLCLLIVIGILYDPDTERYSSANAAIYLCFCYTYFHFNNMGETGRRVRLLRELIVAGRPLSFEEVTLRYGAREIADRRFGRLLASGQIKAVDGHYVLAGKLVYLMALMVKYAYYLIFGQQRASLSERRKGR